MAEFSFPVLVNPANAKRKQTSAGRELDNGLIQQIPLSRYAAELATFTQENRPDLVCRPLGGRIVLSLLHRPYFRKKEVFSNTRGRDYEGVGMLIGNFELNP